MPRHRRPGDPLTRRNQALEALHTIGIEIGGQLDLQTALRRIVEHAARLLEADSGGGINLYEPETGQLHIVVAVGGGSHFLGKTLKPGEGITGQTFATGQAMTVSDYAHWDQRVEEFVAPFFRAVLAAPLRWHDETLGVIFVLSNLQDRIFSTDDIWVLELFAAQAANVIGNARLLEAEHAARTRADAMLEASQALSSSLSLPEVLQEILESCRLVLPFISATIMTLDSGRPHLIAQIGHAGYEQVIIDRNDDEIASLPVFKEMIRDKKCIVIPDVREYPGWVTYPESAYIRSWIGVPLIAHQQVIGMLSLDSDQVDTYTPEHRRLVEVLGVQAAIAIEHARLFGATQEALTQVELLFRASQSITSATNLQTLLRTFVEPMLASRDMRAILLSLEHAPNGMPYRSEVIAEVGGGHNPLLGRRYELLTVAVGRFWHSSHIELLATSGAKKRTPAPTDTFQPILNDLGGGSATLIPLTLEGRQVGAVVLSWPGRHEVDAQERQYYNVLKPQLAAIMENRRLLRATQEAEGRFRDIAQSLSDWLWEVDRKGRVVYCSEQVERVTGYSIGEVIGERVVNFQQPAEFRRNLAVILSRAAHGEPFSDVELWIKHKQGYPVCVLMSGLPVVDAQGRLQGYRGSAKDITGQKKVEQREQLAFNLGQKLTSVLSPDAVVRTFIEQLVNTFGYYHVTVWQLDRRAETLQLVGGIAPFDIERMVRPHLVSLDTRPSLIAKAARERQIVISNNVSTDPDYLAIDMLPETKSEIALPLLQGDQLLGVLDVESSEANTFTPDEVRALQNLATQATIAIENARLYARLSEQADLLEALVAQRTQDVVKERERLQAIVEHAGEGIVFTGPDGAIEYVNHAWEQITGHRARDIIGKDTAAIFVSNGSQGSQFPPYLFSDNKVWQGELHAQRPDGSEYDAGLTLAPVTDARGRIINLVGVMHDITARKQVDQMRSKFVANVSHELRTPITNLKLYHTLISSVSADKQPEYLSTMGEQLGRLENLVEDLLDISRLDRGVVEIHPETIDLNRLIGQVMGGHRMRAERRGIEMKTELSPALPPVWADHRRLTQVLNNLLINAINYTSDGGRISIHTRHAHDDSGDSIMFTIKDTGVGIAPEDQPFIFDRFFRSEAAKSAGIPGTGLGLSIVHDIVELHRGSIGVESAPGKGSAFTVRLPVVAGPG